jgi:tetrahydromethanopterin S-methyltransferase subunit F
MSGVALSQIRGLPKREFVTRFIGIICSMVFALVGGAATDPV